MINPNIGSPEERNPVSVGHRPEPDVVHGVSDHAPISHLNIVYVNVVNDDVPNKLDGDARAVSDVDLSSAAVDRLVALHHQLLLQRDRHAGLEYDPQWLLLLGI